MEREKTRLLRDRCFEVYEKSNLGKIKRRAIFSRWYLSLADEERDYLDASELSFCVPNTRRIRADQKRREVLREARERNNFLDELKKEMMFLKKKRGGHYDETVARAEKLRLLFKIRLPALTSAEACQEYFSGQGWNAYLYEAVKKGRAPKEKKGQSNDNTARAWQEGWSAARETLLSNFSEFF